MRTLWHHPESDSLFTEKPGDWQQGADGALCNEVGEDAEMVARYNRENPGYKVHHWQGPSNCNCNHDRCPVCDGGLGVCLVCKSAECELTTDCPGEPQTELRRGMVCKGLLDFWSGVWL